MDVTLVLMNKIGFVILLLNEIENFVLYCPLYYDLRQRLFGRAKNLTFCRNAEIMKRLLENDTFALPGTRHAP